MAGHFCLWKKGIRRHDIGLGDLMWDAKRKVGVLNGFDLAEFTNQKGASGKGKLPFMALDLLSEKGLRGEIPRLYRHEAESFSWSLIYLCLSTVESEEGGNVISEFLSGWFGNWFTCHNAKMGFMWQEHIKPDIAFAYPNAMDLALFLHSHWFDRYRKQFPNVKAKYVPSRIARGLGRTTAASREVAPYVEEDDDTIFENLVVLHDEALGSEALKDIQDTLFEMDGGFRKVNWSD